MDPSSNDDQPTRPMSYSAHRLRKKRVRRDSNGNRVPERFIDRHLWHVQPVRDVLTGLGVLALLWLGHKISVVTVPLLLAILLAYLFEPVIQFAIRRFGIGRKTAVGGLIAAMVLLVVVPVTVGLTYGIAQTVSFIGQTADNIKLVGTYSEAVRDRSRIGQPSEPEPSGTTSDDAANAANGAEPPDDENQQPNPQDAQSAPAAPASGAPDGQSERVAGAETQADPDAEAERLEIRIALIESQLTSPWRWIADRYIETESESDTAIGESLDAINKWAEDNAKELAQATAEAGINVVRSVGGFFGTVFGVGFLTFLTLFFFFFVSTGWVRFKGFSESLLPDRYRDETIDLLTKFDRVISGFVRGRLTIAFLQAIVFSLSYWAIGVPAAFILGPIVAILSIVPYAALIGLPISMGLLFLEGHEGFRGQWWWVLAAPAAVYFIGQALDDYVWTPVIQGKETGMDTPTILFASLAGGALFGVFGLLIAIPLAACAKILIQELFWPKFKDWAEGRRADALPID